jgi:hypothetical protein
MPVDFTQTLEDRCQLILDAQGAYSQAMRSHDAHWSSMSGVKVGELYVTLHSDLMAMPRPGGADTEKRRQLFEGAIRLRYSILLRKAVAMMKATVAMLDQAQQESRWREKARTALRDIEQAERDEEAALAALPYTREQLQQALDDLSRKAKEQAARGGQK